MRIDANSWYYSPDHGQLCQVIETQMLWGETTCRVWLPGSDSVVRIPASRLKPIDLADEVNLGKTIFQDQLDQKAHAYPEMAPLLVIRVEGGGHE